MEVDEDEDEEDEMYSEADRALLLAAGAGPLPLAAGATPAAAIPPSRVLPGAPGEDRAAAPAVCTTLVLAEAPIPASDGAASGAASRAADGATSGETSGTAGGGASGAVRACLELNRELQRSCREQLLRIDEALHCNAQARRAAGAASDLGEELPVPAQTDADAAGHRRGGESAFGHGDETPALTADAEAAAALREAVPHGEDMPARPRKWPLADRQRLRRAVVSSLVTARHEELLRVQMDATASRAERLEAERQIRHLPSGDAMDDGALVHLLDETQPVVLMATARVSAAPAPADPGTAANGTAIVASAALTAAASASEDPAGGGAGPSVALASVPSATLASVPPVILASVAVPTQVRINWTELARTHLPRRSPAECESRWTQVGLRGMREGGYGKGGGVERQVEVGGALGWVGEWGAED